MKKRGAFTYRDEDVAWFEVEWKTGVASDVIARGMEERGYQDFTVKRCRWLARYRGLIRPPIGPWSGGKAPKISVEAIVSKRLEGPPRPPMDNPRAEGVKRYPAPVGGYRLCL